jgi:hypothetical protein
VNAATTDGAVVSDGGAAGFETVTVTATDVARLPAGSRASAARVYVPLLTEVVTYGWRLYCTRMNSRG